MKKRGKIGSIREELKKGDFRVAIFGSARIKRGDSRYNQIKTLAKMLGDRGMDIITGGGSGLMRAANEGHRKGKNGKKSHAIGLSIKLPRDFLLNIPKRGKASKNLDVVKKFSRFSNRLDNFMLLSNVVVVAPGGVGTLLEFFYSWQLIQTHQICNIPIILLGKQWPDLIKWLEKYPLKNRFFEKKDINLLFLASDCNDAIKMIDKAYEEFKKGDKHYCLNYKKYKLY